MQTHPTPVLNRWIKSIQPRPHAKLRLFCFPYAGGGASSFREWSAHLPESIDVSAIQLPGREDRRNEPPFTHLPPLIETLSQVLLPELDRPFAFWGHSLGALISFELARHLRNHHSLEPAHLLLSGRRAAQLGDRYPQLHTLPDPALLAELRQLNGTPQKILDHAELMRLLLPTLRADFSLCGTYQYQEMTPLTCPISVFGGMQDAIEPYELLQLWKQQTCSIFSLQLLPGDHFFIHTNQSLLLKKIADELQPHL